MVAIVGDSSTGKSTSFRNMPWDQTAIIDTELKGFPFPYKNVIKHYRACKDANLTEAAVDEYASGKHKDVKYVVIDSFFMYMRALLQREMANAGNDVRSAYGNYNKRLVDMFKKLRNDNVIFVCIFQPELVSITDEAGKMRNVQRIFTFGKEHEGRLEREYLVVLWSTTKTDKDGVTTYHFLTNTNGICSAKSPMGMFDTTSIPNDLDMVVSRIEAHQ